VWRRRARGGPAGRTATRTDRRCFVQSVRRPCMTGLAASSRTSSSPGSRTRAGTMASAAGSSRKRSKHQKGITSIDTDRYRTAPRGRTTRQNSTQWLPLALVICAHTKRPLVRSQYRPPTFLQLRLGFTGLSSVSCQLSAMSCTSTGQAAPASPGPARRRRRLMPGGGGRGSAQAACRRCG
jgi:hypothetical protein